MDIEIKKSIKPIKYNLAIKELEDRLEMINDKKSDELIWILEHEEIYTGGTSYKENEILDRSINLIKTNRGGKITYHGPGQIICYFVINLKKRKINIRKFISIIEKTIIDTLSEFKIDSFADKQNIGIWHQNKKEIKKIAAIGIKVRKWIAYHGFSINVRNDLKKYKKIIPCGIRDKGITNLVKIKKQNYDSLNNKIVNNFILNLKM
jgi:lipoyl(octanoyl) transferase